MNEIDEEVNGIDSVYWVNPIDDNESVTSSHSIWVHYRTDFARVKAQGFNEYADSNMFGYRSGASSCEERMTGFWMAPFRRWIRAPLVSLYTAFSARHLIGKVRF